MDVQRGLISLLGTATTSEITLGTPVAVGGSFVISSVRAANSSCISALCRVELTTVVDDKYTKLKATRHLGGTGHNTYVEWQVISGTEFTVQSGENLIASDITTVTAAINEVARSKAFIALSNSANNASSAGTAFVRGRFTSDTQIELRRGLSGQTSVTVVWYVVEWDGATVQAGLVETISTATLVTANIDSIDPAKTFLHYNYYHANSVWAASAFSRGRIEAYDDEGVTKYRVEFRRSVATNAVYQSYFVISHDDISVQHALASTAGTTVTATLVTAVNTDKAFMPTPSVGNAYATSNTDNSLHRGYNTHKLWQDGADSKVTIQREDSTGDLYASWYVVESQAEEHIGLLAAAPMTAKLVAAGVL